jgi:hypothetical protein
MTTINTNTTATTAFVVTPDTTGTFVVNTGSGVGTTALTIGTNQAVQFAGQVNLVAGTTALAPIDFATGTLTTSANSGTAEYDGKSLYFTPIGTQRGIVPGMQYYRLDSGLAGANVNTAQSLFGVGVTLSAGTVYAFEILVALAKAAGTTSHTIGFGYGGTATVNNIMWEFASRFDNAPTSLTGSSNFGYVTATTNTTLTAATTTAAVYYYGGHKGTISVNAGGTFIPQYTLSAAPGGAYTTVAGSYMLIYPIGASGANTSVGTWA